MVISTVVVIITSCPSGDDFCIILHLVVVTITSSSPVTLIVALDGLSIAKQGFVILKLVFVS